MSNISEKTIQCINNFTSNLLLLLSSNQQCNLMFNKKYLTSGEKPESVAVYGVQTILF